MESALTGGFRPVRRTAEGILEKPATTVAPPPVVNADAQIRHITYSTRHVALTLTKLAQGGLAGFAVLHVALCYGGFFTGGISTYVGAAGVGTQRTYYFLTVLSFLGVLDDPAAPLTDNMRRIVIWSRIGMPTL